MRDLVAGDDPQIQATLAVLLAARADVLVLQGIDYDAGLAALTALAEGLGGRGLSYPYRLALRPNTGMPTGLDLDGNGRRGEARDAQGYGWFGGQGGMAILSRFPIATDAVRDFSDLLWRDLPGNRAAGVLSAEALDRLRLASVAAWDVPVVLDGGAVFNVLATHASPPVFDGPEDRNGLRNADELRFWQMYLDGWAPDGPAFDGANFALAGTLNLDPSGGEGRREALAALLAHHALQDPEPRRPGGGVQTADWDDPVPGDLRVDYILPAAGLSVTGSGVIWPEEGGGPVSAEEAALASAHRLVWVDLQF